MAKDLVVERMLVGIDFTEQAREAFYAGLRLAAHFGAETWVLHVSEPIRSLDFGKSRYTETKATIERVEEGVRRRVDELWEQEGLEGVDRRKVHLLVRGGKAAKEIVDTAAAKNIDLIVLGSGGMEQGIGALLGSTAERVLRNAPCSVFCVRPRQAAEQD